jgi:FtsP/CotA-like multicopper oxidase with cupredoxin domain
MHNAATGLQSKGTTQSYAEAIHAGHLKQSSITNGNECRWTVIFIMINFINGKTESQLSQFKAGKVRLRQCRSFVLWLTYAGGKITVVANDGNDVEPVEVDRLIIGVSETYDVVVTIPAANTSYEFFTPEDRTKSALYIGGGIKQLIAPQS